MLTKDLESILERKFVEHTSNLERVFGIPTLIVADTSFYYDFLEDREYDRNDPIINQIHNEYARGFYFWLQDELTDNVTFPAEMLQEFGLENHNIKKGAKSSQKGLNPNKVKGGLGSHGAPFMNNLRKAWIRAAADSLQKVHSVRKSVVKNILRKNPTEVFIPRWLGRDLDESPLKNIYDAILEITDRPGVLIDYSERYGGSLPNSLNEGNDQRIFTKCLAISYDRPVMLLTADSDFLRIRKHFYHDMYVLAQRHGFPIPENKVDIAFRHDTKITILDIEDKDIPFESYLKSLEKTNGKVLQGV